MLTHVILTPHPPAIIPAVGKAATRKFEKTINALLSTILELRKNPPETFVVVSPHGDLLLDSFTIRIPQSENFTADFSEFSTPEIAQTYSRDRLLSAQIIEATNANGFSIEAVDEARLDFGVATPLYYFASAFPEAEVVSLGISLESATTHFEWGKVLREVLDKTEKNVVLLISSELSHTLTKFSPHGYSPLAKEWDERLVGDLKAGDYASVLLYDVFENEEVGECGYRGICTLIGVIDAKPETHQILSYEYPGGVGCAVGMWDLTAKKQ